MKVKDIMTRELFYLREDDRLDLAKDVMTWQHIRHVPVVNKNKQLVGLLTHRDILNASVSSFAKISDGEQKKLFEFIPIKDIMKKNVLTTTPEADLREAAASMIDNKVGCLPVVEDEKLTGIVTEADFLTLAWDVADKGLTEKNYKDIRKYAS